MNRPPRTPPKPKGKRCPACGTPFWPHLCPVTKAGIEAELERQMRREQSNNDANDFYARGEHMPGVTK